MIYSTEKSLTDNADKLDTEVKTEVEKAIAEAKEAKDADDLDAIIAKKDALSQASMKIGQAMYGQGEQASEGEEPKDENTVDADFKEKTDEEKKEEEEEKKDK